MEGFKNAVKSTISFCGKGTLTSGPLVVGTTAILGFLAFVSEYGAVSKHDVYLIGVIFVIAVWLHKEHKELRKVAELERDDIKQQLREAHEENAQQLERLKAQQRADSEEWYRVDELRKIETRGREKAERERDALKHQVINREECLLKMEIPLEKMLEPNMAPLKIQVIEKIEKLAVQLVNDKQLREECENKLKLVTEEIDKVIRQLKDTEIQRDEQIKLGDDVTRERDQERQSREVAQKKIEELENLHTKEKSLREKIEEELNALSLVVGRLTAEKEALERKLKGSDDGWMWGSLLGKLCSLM